MNETQLLRKFASGRKITGSQTSFLKELGYLTTDEYGSPTLTEKAIKELKK